MFISFNEAVNILTNHGIVAVPTETVYGLAGRSDSITAIERIYQAKQRPKNNPLISHFCDLENVFEYITHYPPYLKPLMEIFTPGPISFLLNLSENSPLYPTTASMSTIVCRIPDHPLTLALIKEVGVPLAAPSANTSSKISPTSPTMVENDIGKKIDGVLDGGNCSIGIESTIVDCTHSNFVEIIRPGIIGIDNLKEALIQKGFTDVEVKYAQAKSFITPGSQNRHYAPDKRLLRVSKDYAVSHKLKGVILASHEFLSTYYNVHDFSDFETINLGSIHNLEEVAKNLYFNISKRDESMFELGFYVDEDWGQSSLGFAIQNRLLRASSPYYES